MPENPAQQNGAITDVVVLVHPLYSIIHNLALEKKDPEHKLKDPFSRKNVQFVLGLWGRALKAAAEDPKTLVLIIRSPDYSTRNYPLHRKRKLLWAEEKVDGLLRYAERVLGNRAVVVRGSKVGAADFRKILAAHGFKFGKEWKGYAFGEYVTRCVESHRLNLEWAALTPVQLRQAGRNFDVAQKLIPRLHVNLIPQMSVSALNPSPGEGHALSLGAFHTNVRQNLRRVRAYQRRLK